MSEHTRTVDLTRVGTGRFLATNARGGTLELGQGVDDADGTFTPVELLLVAIAGCSGIDVDLITTKKAEPTRFALRMTAEKVRDELGNHLTDLVLTFDVAFPDDADGSAAAARVPRAVQQSHDRLCTVTRTVAVGTPVETRLEPLAGGAGERGEG